MSALVEEIRTTEPVRVVKESRQPKNHGVGHSDHFQTPPSALAPLLPYLRREWTVWEPACGKGNLVTGLETAGLRVIGTDLLDGRDALTWQPVEPWHALITNPPFSVKDQFLARCYELGKPFALLLPLTALEGQKRQALYRAHGLDLILLPRRVDFETPSGKQGGAWFPVAWFTWGLGAGNSLTFWEPSDPGPTLSLAPAAAPEPPAAITIPTRSPEFWRLWWELDFKRDTGTLTAAEATARNLMSELIDRRQTP